MPDSSLDRFRAPDFLRVAFLRVTFLRVPFLPPPVFLRRVAFLAPVGFFAALADVLRPPAFWRRVAFLAPVDFLRTDTLD